MSSSPVALILGSGKNIGASVADKFASNGYKVAVVSRQKNQDSKYTTIQADLTDVGSVKAAFDKTRQELGEPSVVVYNAYGLTPAAPTDPFSAVEPATFAAHLTVNTASAYAAIYEALKSFKANNSSGVFIYTGNILNTGAIIPPVFTLGAGKIASANLIQIAAQVYSPKGYRFYYADERKADGSPIGNPTTAEAHADFYLQLAQDKEQGPWQATFVKGQGYTKF